MSKKISNVAGQKRKAKSAKRKSVSRKIPQQKLSNFGKMLKRARFMSKNPDIVFNRGTEDATILKDAKSNLAKLMAYFNYLAFAKSLVEHNVIHESYISLDLIMVGKKMVSLNRRITQAPLIDDDAVYLTEVFSIGEDLQDVAMIITQGIERLGDKGAVVDQVIVQCGASLKPKEDGTERTYQEVIDEVIEIAAYDFMVRHEIVKPVSKPAEVQAETESAE